MKLASHLINFVFVLLTLMLSSICNTAQAKDLRNRIGVGLSNIGPVSTESFSVDWQLTQATGLEGNLGLLTQGDNGGWELGVRISRNLFIEDNMIFSLFAGAALLQQKTDGVSSTGYMVESGIGTKFFLEGLPNLGFGFKGAFQIVDAGDLKLQIAPIFNVHYYF